jgi:transcription initiation factor TFIIE subunit alpha
MASLASSEDIQAYCHDLVYQVAYAFYDAPYIILIKLLVQLGVLVLYPSWRIYADHPKVVRKTAG